VPNSLTSVSMQRQEWRRSDRGGSGREDWAHMLVDATNGVTAIGGVVIDGATETATAAATSR